ncbi:Glutathione S-transferase 2 [Chionoecetes opilio]|uniref:glutathione transferase n=1 Tax=Chionoecetes opilio TaxID=41210 RepID=A0A8J5CTV5_CHIOP|nr:Glutathione S-transferase 2 [Chionoecetes opilio]
MRVTSHLPSTQTHHTPAAALPFLAAHTPRRHLAAPHARGNTAYQYTATRHNTTSWHLYWLTGTYMGTEFEDKCYKCAPASHYDETYWFDNEQTVGLDLPDLPYYIDGDVKVTRSNDIMRHIARKHDLCGKTDTERVRIDIMENQSMDFRSGFDRLCYGTFDTDKDIEAYLEALPKTIERFSKFLGTHSWFAGENISFVDFIMYELLEQHLLLAKGCLKDAKNLQEFLKRFEELKAIKKYMGTTRFMKGLFNNMKCDNVRTPIPLPRGPRHTTRPNHVSKFSSPIHSDTRETKDLNPWGSEHKGFFAYGRPFFTFASQSAHLNDRLTNVKTPTMNRSGHGRKVIRERGLCSKRRKSSLIMNMPIIPTSSHGSGFKACKCVWVINHPRFCPR